MKVKVTDIVYDTRDICDGHQWDQNELDLPSEMTLVIEGDVDIEDEIAEKVIFIPNINNYNSMNNLHDNLLTLMANNCWQKYIKKEFSIIKNLFGGRGETINPVVIQNIRKNPARFFKNMFEIYGCDKNGVDKIENAINQVFGVEVQLPIAQYCTTNKVCLLYTSPSPRDRQKSRMPSSA